VAKGVVRHSRTSLRQRDEAIDLEFADVQLIESMGGGEPDLHGTTQRAGLEIGLEGRDVRIDRMCAVGRRSAIARVQVQRGGRRSDEEGAPIPWWAIPNWGWLHSPGAADHESVAANATLGIQLRMRRASRVASSSASKLAGARCSNEASMFSKALTLTAA
jgi:hypothetical protein